MAEREIVENVEAPVEQEQIVPNIIYRLRLSEDGSYKSDLSKIRDAIRANGSKVTLGEIDLIDPTIPGKPIRMYLNFAYQSNSHLPPCSGSIYVLAFGNAGGTWHFNQPIAGLVLPGNPFPGGISGSYASLGFPNILPLITKEKMINAIEIMFSYTGGDTGYDLRAGLARMIIATSEAIRMFPVQTGMLVAIGGGQYQPDEEAIRNWGGHTLGEGSSEDFEESPPSK